MKITIEVEGTLCVECGPNVAVDGEGCCVQCGATAYGSWLQAQLVEAAAEEAREEAEMRAEHERALESSQRMARMNAAGLPLAEVLAWEACGTDDCAYCEAFTKAREERIAVRPSR